jgi:hypothetical protein
VKIFFCALSIARRLAHLQEEAVTASRAFLVKLLPTITESEPTMEYMLMFFESTAEGARRDDPAQAPAYWGAWSAYVGAMSASGCVKNGHGLEPPRTATTVRVAGGKRQVQDGPFADTREHIGGYFVIDVPSLDTALEWAARAPCASAGRVEVWPVMPPQRPTA